MDSNMPKEQRDWRYFEKHRKRIPIRVNNSLATELYKYAEQHNKDITKLIDNVMLTGMVKLNIVKSDFLNPI